MSTCAQAFYRLYEIIVRLRAPDGCAWDLAQTPVSMCSSFLEETYEALEAILEEGEAQHSSYAHVQEELGDVLMNVCMIAYMYEQRGVFSLADVVTALTEKLIRRHPHVFGQTEGFPGPENPKRAQTAQEVFDQWERIKTQVERRRAASPLEGIPRTVPPLMRASKIQKNASRARLFCPTRTEVVRECARTFRALRAMSENSAEQSATQAAHVAVGALLTAVISFAHLVGVDPVLALIRANADFVRRFSCACSIPAISGGTSVFLSRACHKPRRARTRASAVRRRARSRRLFFTRHKLGNMLR